MDFLSSIPPGTAPATDVVTAKVFINGTVLSSATALHQITASRAFNKVAYARLVFLDGSVSDRDFPLSNDPKFKPGNTIRVQLGYHGEVETVFEGIIVKHAIKVRQQGTSLLLIEAKDKAIQLTASRKSRYYNQKTDSAVITELAGDLRKEIEPTTILHPQLVQFDSTDWDFIVTRAEANGMLVATEDGKLIVKKPAALAPPVLVATYGQNIWEFEAEMDARRQVQEVTGHSWDYTRQQTENSTPGAALFAENGNLSARELGGVLKAQVQLSHPGHLTQAQLQAWADAYALRNQLSKTTGRVRIDGNAAVKPGAIMTLAGVGDRFNGNVLVTGVLHQYDGSWRTDVQFGWREEWFYKRENVMEKPASGLLPGINGLHIGVVQGTDDTDGGGQYRVKVHVPTITAGNEGLWARIATLEAGPNRGAYFRPQAGDEVILGFLNDDPREAIVLGYLHSKSTNQAPLPEQQGQLQSGFVTKEGIKLIFDDTHKRITLLVPTAAGQKSLIMNNESSAFEIKDENQNTIKMDAQGITIQAGRGNVTIKGTMVMIN